MAANDELPTVVEATAAPGTTAPTAPTAPPIPHISECDFSTIDIAGNFYTTNAYGGKTVKWWFMHKGQRCNHWHFKGIQRFEDTPAGEVTEMFAETPQADPKLNAVSKSLQPLRNELDVWLRKDEEFRAGLRAAIWRHREEKSTDPKAIAIVPPSQLAMWTSPDYIQVVNRGLLKPGNFKPNSSERYEPSIEIKYYGWDKQIRKITYKTVKQNGAEKRIPSHIEWKPVILSGDAGRAAEDERCKFQLAKGTKERVVDPVTGRIEDLECFQDSTVLTDTRGKPFWHPETMELIDILVGPQHVLPNCTLGVVVGCFTLTLVVNKEGMATLVPGQVAKTFQIWPPAPKQVIQMPGTVTARDSAAEKLKVVSSLFTSAKASSFEDCGNPRNAGFDADNAILLPDEVAPPPYAGSSAAFSSRSTPGGGAQAIDMSDAAAIAAATLDDFDASAPPSIMTQPAPTTTADTPTAAADAEEPTAPSHHAGHKRHAEHEEEAPTKQRRRH